MKNLPWQISHNGIVRKIVAARKSIGRTYPLKCIKLSLELNYYFPVHNIPRNLSLMRINNDRSLNSPKPSSDDRDQTFINPYMTKKKKRARRVSASESEPILVVVCQRQDHYQKSRFIPLRSTPSYFAFRRLKCKGSESWSERSVCEPGASNNSSWFV